MRLATRIALLDSGSLAFLGSPEEFRTSEVGEVRSFLNVLETRASVER